MLNLHKILKIPYYIWRTSRDIIFSYYKLGTWDLSWRFHKLPLIRKHKKATIELGKNIVLCSDPNKNSIGVFQKVILNSLKYNSFLKIGENVGISGATISCENRILIGNNVLIGSGVLITDSDSHPLNPLDRDNNDLIKTAPIIIEDNVFIGARSIILKGVCIGQGSVVGAGSVVVKNIPPMCICAGNPAKIIKFFN